MAIHQPMPMAAVNSPQRVVVILERSLASPASARASPGKGFFSPGSVGGGGLAAVAVCPGARWATTMRRSLAEYFGWHVVRVRVGVGVALSTSTWLGFTTWTRATLYV